MLVIHPLRLQARLYGGGEIHQPEQCRADDCALIRALVYLTFHTVVNMQKNVSSRPGADRSTYLAFVEGALTSDKLFEERSITGHMVIVTGTTRRTRPEGRQLVVLLAVRPCASIVLAWRDSTNLQVPWR